MADSEIASPSDMRVLAMEISPVQLPVSSSPIVEPEQSLLIAQFQSIPATRNADSASYMGISAVIPTIQFPEGQPAAGMLQCPLDLEHSLAIDAAPKSVGLDLPTCMHLESSLSAVPDS